MHMATIITFAVERLFSIIILEDSLAIQRPRLFSYGVKWVYRVWLQV
jgi:hypothetical protein